MGVVPDMSFPAQELPRLHIRAATSLHLRVKLIKEYVMNMLKGLVVASGIAALVIGGLAEVRRGNARDPAPPGTRVEVQVGEDQSAPVGASFRAKELLGSRVMLDGGAEGGTIDDLVVDESGNVDYLIVLIDDRQLVTIPWDAVSFRAEERTAMISIAPERYRQVPTYTVEQYPVFTAPSYRTNVYEFFGLTPGQERRAIRRAIKN
jgi:hypothetical protein